MPQGCYEWMTCLNLSDRGLVAKAVLMGTLSPKLLMQVVNSSEG